MTGKIGNITYKITKQTGYDEIKFFIPVTNTSSIEQCFIIKLCGAGGNEIDREPHVLQPWEVGKFANKIAPGATETMVIDSDGMFWHIHDVAGQTVKFELVADPVGMLGMCSNFNSSYTSVDTKTKVIPAYGEDESIVEEAEDFMKVLIVLIIVILIAYAATKFR